MKVHYPFLICCFFIMAAGVKAQTISGMLIDEQYKPLPYANVILQTADSIYLAGTTIPSYKSNNLALLCAPQSPRPSNPYQVNIVQMAILDSSTACGVAPIQKLYSLSSLLIKLVIKYLLLGFCKIVSIKSIACSNVS